MPHNMPHETISFELGDQVLVFETGKIARQANGAVIVRCGDTIIFNSVCAATEAKADEGFDWGGILGGGQQSSRGREGVLEAAAKSAARAIGSQIGRQIIRGVLGSLLGGRK